MRKILVTICLFVVAMNYVCAENNVFFQINSWKFVPVIIRTGVLDSNAEKRNMSEIEDKDVELLISKMNGVIFVSCKKLGLSLRFEKDEKNRYFCDKDGYSLKSPNNEFIFFEECEALFIGSNFYRITCIDGEKVWEFNDVRCYYYDKSSKQDVELTDEEWIKSMKNLFENVAVKKN
ncbi:hypothetical protein [Parabacteroides sp.]